MKRVLLTGVGGFIGSHMLAHFLETTDWEIVGIASWKHRGTPERILELPEYQANKQRVTILTHDLTARLNDSQCQQIGRVNYIVNCAAESHVDRSIDEPAEFVENNVQVMLTMLEYARSLGYYGLEKFIQISTDEVYGAALGDVRHAEWSTILPSNPYSASKACQEALAISYWRTYGVPIIITNTMNNYGPRQDKEKFVAKVINAIVNDETVVVHGPPTGESGSRFYIHVRDHADAVKFLLENLSPALYSNSGNVDRPDRYNVVGEEEITNLDVVHRIAKLFNKAPRVSFVDFHATRPGHDRRYALDGSLLAELGWYPKIGFETGIINTLQEGLYFETRTRQAGHRVA